MNNLKKAAALLGTCSKKNPLNQPYASEKSIAIDILHKTPFNCM